MYLTLLLAILALATLLLAGGLTNYKADSLALSYSVSLRG
jgi:outer membrane murein-binding lipoprotein Lpp